MVCVTLSLPSSSAFLPPAREPPEPGIHGPCAPQRVPPPRGRSGHRVGGREQRPFGPARRILFRNIPGAQGQGWQGESARVRRVSAVGAVCGQYPRLGHTARLQEAAPGAARRRNLPGSPRPACAPLPWPPGRCHSRRGARGFPARAPAQPSSGRCGGPAAGCAPASPVEEGRTQACARWLSGGGRAAPFGAGSPPPLALPNP